MTPPVTEAVTEAVTEIGAGATGMAAMGKTTLVLLALVGIILLCGWLLRKLGIDRSPGSVNPALKVIASKAVGTKERVVVVELEDTWLVLGVGAGRVDMLHERPAPPRSRTDDATAPATAATGDSFAGRFAQALKQNFKHRGDQA